MRFETSLLPGKLVRRYNRFLADIELESGETITAHCANPGAMLGIKDPGVSVWVSEKPPESSGKLNYRWEIVEADNTLVGVNTMRPNSLVEEALHAKKIPELSAYTSIRREVKYGKNSRVDFLLEGENLPPCYLEVKNVHLKRQKGAEFPDSVTARGAKHLQELGLVREQGARALLLYVVQREDCDTFSLAADIDPAYAHAADRAKKKGVETLCYRCKVTLDGIEVTTPLEIV